MSVLEILEPAATSRTHVKSFVGPWTRKGKQLLLACGKCQRKLKHDGDETGLAKLRKVVKQRGKAGRLAIEFQVIQTKCLKVCPRAGVAVCTQAQLGVGRGSVVRSVGDVDLLLAECAADPAFALQQKVKRGELL